MSEQLARLNCKTQSFTDSGGGSSDLTPADIAAALIGSPPIGRLALIKRVTGQTWQNDFAVLNHKVLVYADKRNWLDLAKETKSHTFGKLTELCLSEQVVDSRCGTCKGADWPYKGSCPTCKGTKQGKLTTSYRARALEVPRSSYIRNWEYKRNEIAGYFLDLIPELEWIANKKFNRYISKM